VFEIADFENIAESVCKCPSPRNEVQIIACTSYSDDAISVEVQKIVNKSQMFSLCGVGKNRKAFQSVTRVQIRHKIFVIQYRVESFAISISSKFEHLSLTAFYFLGKAIPPVSYDSIGNLLIGSETMQEFAEFIVDDVYRSTNGCNFPL